MTSISVNPFKIYKGLPRSIYVIFFARMIDSMGSVVLPMIALILTEKIGFSKSEAGMLATIFMISQAPFLLLGGKLADKFGCKKVIIIFNSLAALFYIPCGFMKPHIAMALMIVFAANMFSTSSPAINSFVTEIAAPGQLKTSYSILYLGYNLGMAIGPAIGGILFNDYLQLLFIIDGVTCLLSVALIAFLVPDAHKKKQVQTTVKDDLIKDVGSYKFVLKSPALLIFSAILLVYNFCYAQWSFVLPLQSQFIFGLNGAKFYSFLVSINALAVIILTPFLTSITKKYKPLSIVAGGGLFYALTFTIFGLGARFYQFVVAAIILTIGQILININTNIYIAEQAPKNCIGRANSVLTIINGIGYAIGPVIMGYVLVVLPFSTSWYMTAGIMAAAVGVMIALCLRMRRKMSV